MTLPAAVVANRVRESGTRLTAAFAFALLLALAISVGVVSRVHAPSVVATLGGASFVGIVIWMFLSTRPEWPLVVLGFYLGLLDGYLKLSTGHEWLTAARDILLYAIVLGILVRAAVRRERVSLPPLGGWVIAFVLVVVVQLFNPADTGTLHTLGALRPELEFMPLFFLGYQVVRTTRRLRMFFLILLVCASANAAVNIAQFNLSPSALESWGPGYAAYVAGTGPVSGRTFEDSSGQTRVRPFGLGTDAGSGAQFGLIAIGGAFALLMLGGFRNHREWLLAAVCVGAPLAIFTGQLRTATVAAFIAVAFFLLVTLSADRIVPALAALGIGVALTIGAASLIVAGSTSGILSRYTTITPSNLLASTQADRGDSLGLVPSFIVDYPLGGGLGSVGPASEFAGGTSQPLNGETSFTFYLSDVGLPGLLTMLMFNLTIVVRAFRYIRRMPHEERLLVAALATGVVGLFVEWVSESPLVTSPGAPYFWFTAGALAYWLYPKRRASQTLARADN